MAKKYGVKVKRTRNLYKPRKSTGRKILEAMLLIIILGALVFVGYAAGKPLIEFFKNGGTSSPDNSISAWTPDPVLSSESDSPSETTDSTAEPTTPPPVDAISENAITAPATALASKDALTKYLADAKSKGYSSVIFTLKDEAGILSYKSNVAAIKDDKTINAGKLTLADITGACETAKITPVARINTLKDSTTPTVITKSYGYVFADDSWAWLDAAAENGGKQWANPFLAPVPAHIANLTDEITKAGFKSIILANTIFPNFQAYDYTILSPDIKSPTRYTKLLAVVQAAENKAKANDSSVCTEISAKQLVEINTAAYLGTAEIFKAKTDLEKSTLVVVYNKKEMNNQMVITDKNTVKLDSDISKAITAVFKQVKSQTGNINIVPCVDSSGLTDKEISSAVKALEGLGYKNYFVK